MSGPAQFVRLGYSLLLAVLIFFFCTSAGLTTTETTKAASAVADSHSTSFDFSQGSGTTADTSYQHLKELFYRDSLTADSYALERCYLDLYYPSGIDSFATVIWFHGGGLRAGERYLPEELIEQQLAVVPVNYRLYPRVGNPLWTEDAAAAVAWVLEHIADYGGDPSRVYLAGHSAGGYLASMVAMDRRYLEAFGHSADQLAGVFSFSGHTITHFTVREERGLEWQDVVVDEFAPLAHIRPDLPPFYLICADRERELYGRYEEVAYFWRMMKAVGVPKVELYELDGYNHGNMPGPAFGILLEEIRGQN